MSKRHLKINMFMTKLLIYPNPTPQTNCSPRILSISVNEIQKHLSSCSGQKPWNHFLPLFLSLQPNPLENLLGQLSKYIQNLSAYYFISLLWSGHMTPNQNYCISLQTGLESTFNPYNLF